ncbi:MAG: hypothetical protein AB7P22_09190 [Vicinamibacterales bacterium]
MIRRILAALLLTLVGTTAGAQAPARDQPQLQTREEIASIAGGRTGVDDLLILAVDHWFRGNGQSRTLGVLTSQFPGQLAHPTIRFVQLDDAALKAHVDACGVYLWVLANRIGQRQVRMTVGESGPCSTSSRDFQFTDGPNGWELTRSGAGGNSGSGTACSCP